jgi:N-formylglutamate amidohydrolase
MSDNVIRIHKGEWPIILTAPHSGRHKYHYPERQHGVFCDDDCTKELLQDVSEAMYNKSGFRPHRIRTRLARVVCEMNRAGDETHNSPEAMEAYFQYHAAIEDSIKNSILKYDKYPEQVSR